MSQPPGSHSSRYGGPNNIVIVPTVSFTKDSLLPSSSANHDRCNQQGTEQNEPSAEINKGLNTKGQSKPLIEQPKKSSVEKLKQTISMDRIEPHPMVANLNPTSISLEHKSNASKSTSNEDVNKNLACVEDLNKKTKKVNSWASNYLQSIGHNKKAIKMNLSLKRNKIQRIETISTSNELNKPVAQPTLYKDTEMSSYEVFNTTDNYREFNELNNSVIDESINIGNIKTLYPPIQSDMHLKVTPLLSTSDNIPAPVNSSILVDTIYSSDNISKAPAYATLLAKSNGEATYCYNDGHKEIDILDAINTKTDRENSIEQKSRTMNLPTHKNMCEDFIKEISFNKSSAFVRKGDRSQSSPPAKRKEARHIKRKSSTPKPETKINKNKLKELAKTIKNIDKQLIKKSKPSSAEKDALIKNNQDSQRYKKQHNSNPDFDNLSKHICDKETDKQPKIEIHSPERSNLKRARTCSKDRRSSSSEILPKSPIRSVVQIADNYQSNSPKRKCFEESFDLRSKLNRVNQRINRRKKENGLSIIPKQRENIKITVENHIDEKQKSPKKSGVLKYKTNKCKKLKLIINVVCHESDDDPDTSTGDSSNSETENNPTHHMDLSFLDDFNVDEIVDSLGHSPKHKIKSPLSHESKSGNNNKMPVEPELKLATILSMLNAKSETSNNFIKTECKTEETKKTNRETLSNMNRLNPVPVTTSIKENTTHDLAKIVCQTKLHQQNTALPDVIFLDAKCGMQTEDCNISVNISNEQHSEDNERIDIDESVIINEQEISIIDLTDENVATETNNITTGVTATPNNIQQEKQSSGKAKERITVDFNQHQIADNKIVNQLEPIPITQRTKHIHYQNENGQSASTAFEIETSILNQQHDSVIDLTDDTNYDKTIFKNMANIGIPDDKEYKIPTENVNENMKYTVYADTTKQKNTNTQMDIESEIFVNRAIHLVPLPSKNDNLSKEKEKPVFTKIQAIDSEKEYNKNYNNTVIQLETNKSIENVKNISPMDMGLIDSVTQRKSDTATVLKSANQNVKNVEEQPKKVVKNVSDTSNPQSKDNTLSAIKKINNMFETNAASKIIENIVKIVWESKTELKNTSKTNETKNEKLSQVNNTKTEVGTASKSNTIENKATNEKKTELSDSKTKELITTNYDEVIRNKENVRNVSGASKTETKDSAPNDIKCLNKIFESKTAKEILEIIVENVWDTKNELENTSKTNDTKNEAGKAQTNDTKTEIGDASKSSTIEKKVKNVMTDKYIALSALLEERMLEYLNNNIKITKHIRHGKFSNIFRCKDSKGQIYAAKVLKNDDDHQALGIEKERMIRQLQQDIPRQNLNTVYLIDCFVVEKYWCFLTEYYPQNLLQALQRSKPFNIDRVQNLARQLISAVMVLRNNNIVHSDIKPTHILLDSSINRLKLCGFDGAYYRNNVVLLPNIGTISYRAPEIILGFSAGHSIDVWSSALVIYQMATNLRLFHGFFNNDILYKQMCTFGNLPRDMVETSIYKNKHFQGRIFMKRVGCNGQDAVLFANFYKTKRLQKSLWFAFNKLWQANVRNADAKMTALTSLLEQMLVLDPRHRLSIEFVCGDPFIYEMW